MVEAFASLRRTSRELGQAAGPAAIIAEGRPGAEAGLVNLGARGGVGWLGRGICRVTGLDPARLNRLGQHGRH